MEERKSLNALKRQAAALMGHARALIYPNLFDSPASPLDDRAAIRAILGQLLSQVRPDMDPDQAADRLLSALPEIRGLLETDIQAAYEGDPAASCPDEVMLAYPAFEAISIFRIAHELYRMEIPVIPRIMTEYAHQTTGIDIHPGASIGPYFFIDHGTGVVIGETTTIGEHVKLYQGVTLGAKSFDVNPDGSLVKGIKRHPDVGNHVVIYAGATVLGGGTVIGDNCVIGGNVWLTHSVPPGSTVLAAHNRNEIYSNSDRRF